MSDTDLRVEQNPFDTGQVLISQRLSKGSNSIRAPYSSVPALITALQTAYNDHLLRFGEQAEPVLGAADLLQTLQAEAPGDFH